MGLLTRSRPEQRRPFFTRRNGHALTASALRAEAAPDGGLRRLAMPWQIDAMRRYRDTGELWNPAQYYSRSMERIRFYPALRDNRGNPKEVTSGPLLDLFNRIQSPSNPPGDLSELAGSYARLQFVIGDGLLTVSEWDGDEVWEYLSPMEMRALPRPSDRDRQEYRRMRAPGITPDELIEASDDDFEPLDGDEVRVWRLWRRHPEYSQWSDSPVRPILDLYSLLNRLTLAVSAEASSRAAQRGLLFMPDELSFGPADSSQEENPEEDPLMREFQESMARSIRDPGSAEAMSPFFLRAPGVTQTSGGAVPTADLIKWIALGPGDRYLEGEMWDRTIARIAADLDLPKEMLTGIEDVSHWSAWFLDEVGFRQHTGPTVVRFCNDIAAAYLRPAAINDGLPDAEQVMVWFDPSQAINHPDETGVVATAYNDGVVNAAYYRKKIGAPDDAKPSDDEHEEWMAIKLKKFPSDEEPDGPTGETNPAEGGRGGDVDEGTPGDSQRRPAGNRPPSPAPNMAAMVLGAAEMSIDRARELAGSRIWRRAQTCVECREAAKDVPQTLIAAALGPQQVRDLIEGHIDETVLVDGIGEKFALRLRAWGIDGSWPEQLGQMVEQHAMRTLYETEPPPLPPGFLAAVRRASG